MTATPKIIVVEDNDFVRTQIVRFLEFEKFTVIELADGVKALEDIKADPEIKIAIVDVRMEPVDGFEFIRTLKGLNVKMSVILVTGDDNPDLLNEAAKWGVSAVLLKPVQKDRLVKTVQRTVQNLARLQ